MKLQIHKINSIQLNSHLSITGICDVMLLKFPSSVLFSQMDICIVYVSTWNRLVADLLNEYFELIQVDCVFHLRFYLLRQTIDAGCRLNVNACFQLHIDYFIYWFDFYKYTHTHTHRIASEVYRIFAIQKELEFQQTIHKFSVWWCECGWYDESMNA